MSGNIYGELIVEFKVLHNLNHKLSFFFTPLFFEIIYVLLLIHVYRYIHIHIYTNIERHIHIYQLKICKFNDICVEWLLLILHGLKRYNTTWIKRCGF